MSGVAGDSRKGAVAPPAEPAARWRDLFCGPSGLQMAVMAGGIALHSITLYITTSILPTVVADIGGMPLYAWNTTVFVVAAIVGAAAAVQVLQQLGVRWAYIVVAASFAAGSALCALAPSMPVMLLGRLIQGLAGGSLLAGPYVLVHRTLPARLWPRALALFSGMWGVATLLGPAVGGGLAEYSSWRLAFGALVLVALALAVSAAIAFWHTNPRTAAKALPMRQLATLAIAVLSASTSTLAGSALLGALCLVVALGLLIGLRRADQAAASRLLPRAAYDRGGLLGPLYGTSALMAITVTCTELFIPLFLQRNQGHSALLAGYIAAAASAGWTIGALISASMTPSRAPRLARAAPWLSALALAVLCISMSQPSASPTVDSTLAIVGSLIALGLGVGLAWPHLAGRIMAAAPPAEADTASGAIMTVQLIATTMSAAVGGFLIETAAGSADADLTTPAAWLFGLLMLAPFGAILLWPRDNASAFGPR
jgi:MFS family permease